MKDYTELLKVTLTDANFNIILMQVLEKIYTHLLEVRHKL
jgi:hypothetical protein